MDLRDWRILLADEPCEEEGHIAEMAVVVGRRIGHLSVSKEWGSFSAEDRRTAIVHELLHVYVDQTKVALCFAQETMPKAAYAVLYQAHQAAIEFAVDGIALVLAPFLPLPGDGA